MGKFARTRALMGASWEILKKDQEILIFPLLSLCCCLLVMASFVLPWFTDASWLSLMDGKQWINKLQSLGGGITHIGDKSFNSNAPYYVGILLLFYLCNYFVIVFFNAAIVACVTIRMEGGNPTVADGLRAAFGCLPFIVAWVLFAATVGHLLRLLADRSGPLGRIITGFLGIAWSAAIFLVIPVLVVEKVDPITALRKSVLLFQKTWGEEFISNFSFGMIFSILAIPAYFFAILGMRAGLGFLISVGLAAIYLIILAMFQSALQTIFQAALYFYARNGEAPAGFPGELLANSVVRR